MALRIHGNNQRFHQAVLGALAEICPCWIYTITRDGVIELQSPAEGGQRGFCRCYCRHRAGCNLMADLVAATETVVIGRGSPAAYHPGSRRLRWNPRSRPTVRTADGNRRSSPATVLGHELIHAHHHNEGTLAEGRTGGIKNEEINTVRGENQLREERSEPRRTHYGRRRVPNPDAGDLDTRDRHDCDCDEPKRAILHEDREQDMGHALLDGFDGLIDGDREDLSREVQLALGIRDEHPAFMHLLRSEESLRRSRGATLLERVDAGTLDYRFILFRTEGKSLLLETNVAPIVDGEGVDMGDPGDIRVYLVDGERPDTLAVDFPEGVGGDADVLDGPVDFLTVRSGDQVRRCVLVGSDFPLFSDWEIDRPEGKEDAARYDAISRIFSAWARVLAEPMEPLRVFPGDGRS